MKHFLVMELYKFIHLLTRPKLFNTEQSCFLIGFATSCQFQMWFAQTDNINVGTGILFAWSVF